ncbi:MAG: YraN family protein [Candidatus Pacebacteria bacterium]|nr:YraN family protein [Candidatus Paceibacterota bacterium]
MDTKTIGILGENIAVRYLIKNGYKVINRNLKEGFDEIDIIAMGKDGTLIFFEVKTAVMPNGMTGPEFYGFMPEDHLTQQKVRRISRACWKFADRHRHLINEETGWRIDLIAITIKEDDRYSLHHYKNV